MPVDIAENETSGRTDEELVSFVLKDKNSYRYLIERYEAKLRRYIFRISGFSQVYSAH